jgi:hypothetical protein
MAIDYVLKFPCAVRKNIPEQKLVALVGYMSLAQSAVSKIRKSSPSTPMETIYSYEVNMSQSGPDGTVKQVPMTIGQLAELAQPLGEHRGQCQECRANIADRPFGCIAKINYPITKESEQWLLSRLTSNTKDPDLMLLFRFLSDLEIDGRAVDAMRPKLFELQEPVIRRWQGPSDQIHITSSQIIEMLAFGGNLVPQQATLYTKLLGLASVLSDPHPPSDNIEQFKTLMCAIVMAGRLDAEITVDA